MPDTPQQGFGSYAVIYIGGRDPATQKETLRVYQQVPLAPDQFLVTVIAAQPLLAPQRTQRAGSIVLTGRLPRTAAEGLVFRSIYWQVVWTNWSRTAC